MRGIAEDTELGRVLSNLFNKVWTKNEFWEVTESEDLNNFGKMLTVLERLRPLQQKLQEKGGVTLDDFALFHHHTEAFLTCPNIYNQLANEPWFKMIAGPQQDPFAASLIVLRCRDCGSEALEAIKTLKESDCFPDPERDKNLSHGSIAEYNLLINALSQPGARTTFCLLERSIISFRALVLAGPGTISAMLQSNTQAAGLLSEDLNVISPLIASVSFQSLFEIDANKALEMMELFFAPACLGIFKTLTADPLFWEFTKVGERNFFWLGTQIKNISEGQSSLEALQKKLRNLSDYLADATVTPAEILEHLKDLTAALPKMPFFLAKSFQPGQYALSEILSSPICNSSNQEEFFNLAKNTIRAWEEHVHTETNIGLRAMHLEILDILDHLISHAAEYPLVGRAYILAICWELQWDLIRHPPVQEQLRQLEVAAKNAVQAYFERILTIEKEQHVASPLNQTNPIESRQRPLIDRKTAEKIKREGDRNNIGSEIEEATVHFLPCLGEDAAPCSAEYVAFPGMPEKTIEIQVPVRIGLAHSHSGSLSIISTIVHELVHRLTDLFQKNSKSMAFSLEQAAMTWKNPNAARTLLEIATELCARSILVSNSTFLAMLRETPPSQDMPQLPPEAFEGLMNRQNISMGYPISIAIIREFNKILGLEDRDLVTVGISVA